MSNRINKAMSMKLPNLEIKKFSEDRTEYKSFKDSVEIAVNQRSDTAEIEKFSYFKHFLTEKVFRAIKGLAITTESSEEGLQVLDERYGYVEELTKLPVVHDNEDTVKLRELYNKIETNLRSLRAIGIEADTYRCILVLISKKRLIKRD